MKGSRKQDVEPTDEGRCFPLLSYNVQHIEGKEWRLLAFVGDIWALAQLPENSRHDVKYFRCTVLCFWLDATRTGSSTIKPPATGEFSTLTWSTLCCTVSLDATRTRSSTIKPPATGEFSTMTSSSLYCTIWLDSTRSVKRFAVLATYAKILLAETNLIRGSSRNSGNGLYFGRFTWVMQNNCLLAKTQMKNFGITLPGVPKPITTCRVFEDNVGALELANTPKLRPRTKHLAVQLHHFHQYILDKTITVEKVDTKYQRADIMTKALPWDAFEFLRKTITGW